MSDPASPQYDEDYSPDQTPSKADAQSPQRDPYSSDAYSPSKSDDPYSDPSEQHSPDRGGLPPIRSHSQSDSRRSPKKSRKYPPITTISYPARSADVKVADFLDTSKPLVKSTKPLTHPKAPAFISEETADERRARRAEQKMRNAVSSAQINNQRLNERKYLKAQYEFEREKKHAERAIYHRERMMDWGGKLTANPLAVDLVADNERIEEENYVREHEERRRRLLAERKKRRIKNEIIVKALAEVPLLEEARRQKREMLDQERRAKALRDVQRVEAIQERKLRDNEVMARERQAKLDQRVMSA